ncbi:squalene monooxygenase [Monoraphidium neglectum]|uniref:Squalene monooxygenase n=1 Tax=Monoraphidium neglectum TaxID=145388 RepID=A0A0D2JRQ6_9CHLO|nr:squalene monooxygenase [Monoraphidium neglectum]KIZ01653.1 squalene monooxygenase [Monoraphidium neglectum]|eukprot:XP_013900672.1 squalene monooxygenase [Monoraphidium neglectum]
MFSAASFANGAGHGTHTPLPKVPSSEDYGSDPEVWDLIVVGAGVAGSALAFGQAKDGRRVLLLERDFSQPDRIVGELLQPGGYLMLKRMGLEDCTDGIDSQRDSWRLTRRLQRRSPDGAGAACGAAAPLPLLPQGCRQPARHQQEVYGYALYKNGRYACIKYPMEGLGPDVAGRSFHHGRFVQQLRYAAAGTVGVTAREATVRRLLNDARCHPSPFVAAADRGLDWSEGEPVSGVQYKTGDGEVRTARAHLTVVCDGMYSQFRKQLADPDIKHPSYFVGLLLKGVSLPFPNHGHVVLAKPSPILFYPISSTEVRCLVDVPGAKLPADLPGYLRTHVAPEVPPELRSAFLDSLDGATIRTMQNKQLTSKPLHQPGALLLGDAFNMRHPLTGGGMTVALSDTRLLCEMLRPLPDFQDAIATAGRTAEFYTARKPLSATINTLANALYKVFCATGDPAQEEMRSACFDYLTLGGIYSEGPISLLSGLNPSPSNLVMHFFMVALYGVGRLLLPRPTLRGLYMAVALLLSASKIILPILWSEGLRAVFLPALAPKPLEGIRKVALSRSVSSRSLGFGA